MPKRAAAAKSFIFCWYCNGVALIVALGLFDVAPRYVLSLVAAGVGRISRKRRIAKCSTNDGESAV